MTWNQKLKPVLRTDHFCIKPVTVYETFDGKRHNSYREAVIYAHKLVDGKEEDNQ